MRGLLVVTLLVAIACGEPTTVSDGTLTVERHVASLELHNSSAAPIFYLVADRRALALLDWVPCVSSNCPSVPARKSVSLRYSDIIGYSSGTGEAVVYVYWWRVTSDGRGGLRQDSVRTIIARL